MTNRTDTNLAGRLFVSQALLKERQDSFVHFKSFLRPNIVSASICLALGAVVFFFPSIWIALQGLLFGVLSFIDGWPMFLSRMMPHSLLEIPLAVFTAAAATQIGWTIFRSWKSGCRRVCAEEVRSLGVVWLQVSGLLVIAAILESYVRLHVFL